MDKTLRLVRISLLIIAIQRVLRFFSESYSIKAIENFFLCLYSLIQTLEALGEFSTVITVSNSPNPSRVYIRLCKHGNRLLLLKSKRKAKIKNQANFFAFDKFTLQNLANCWRVKQPFILFSYTSHPW